MKRDIYQEVEDFFVQSIDATDKEVELLTFLKIICHHCGQISYLNSEGCSKKTDTVLMSLEASLLDGATYAKRQEILKKAGLK